MRRLKNLTSHSFSPLWHHVSLNDRGWINEWPAGRDCVTHFFWQMTEWMARLSPKKPAFNLIFHSIRAHWHTYRTPAWHTRHSLQRRGQRLHEIHTSDTVICCSPALWRAKYKLVYSCTISTARKKKKSSLCLLCLCENIWKTYLAMLYVFFFFYVCTA